MAERCTFCGSKTGRGQLGICDNCIGRAHHPQAVHAASLKLGGSYRDQNRKLVTISRFAEEWGGWPVVVCQDYPQPAVTNPAFLKDGGKIMASPDDPKLSKDECRAEAERLVFKAGGWLTVANKFEIPPDALKRHFMSAASVGEAREWLRSLKVKLAAD